MWDSIEPYRRQPSGLEGMVFLAGQANGALAGIVIGLIILTILVIYAIKEIYRIYERHGGGDTKAARYLSTAGALFGLALLASAVLAFLEHGMVAALVAAWSFLVFIVVIEWIDHCVASKDPRELWAGQSIDEVLQRPWWTPQAA